MLQLHLVVFKSNVTTTFVVSLTRLVLLYRWLTNDNLFINNLDVWSWYSQSQGQDTRWCPIECLSPDGWLDIFSPWLHGRDTWYSNIFIVRNFSGLLCFINQLRYKSTLMFHFLILLSNENDIYLASAGLKLSIALGYINSGWEREAMVLGCTPYSERHTSANLAQFTMVSFLPCWKILYFSFL